MKTKHLLLILPIVGGLVTGFAPSARAINLGFETGDFTGWTVNPPGLASVVKEHWGDSNPQKYYTAVEGTYFARLWAGAGAGWYTITSQEFTLGAGSLVSGWAAFDYRDYHPFDDTAKVRILKNNVEIATPWSVNGLSVPDYWDGPWTYWSWTAPSAGTYKLELSVANLGDNGLHSAALFDAHFVPEVCSTLALMGLAALGLVTFRRKLA